MKLPCGRHPGFPGLTCGAARARSNALAHQRFSIWLSAPRFFWPPGTGALLRARDKAPRQVHLPLTGGGIRHAKNTSSCLGGMGVEEGATAVDSGPVLVCLLVSTTEPPILRAMDEAHTIYLCNPHRGNPVARGATILWQRRRQHFIQDVRGKIHAYPQGEQRVCQPQSK